MEKCEYKTGDTILEMVKTRPQSTDPREWVDMWFPESKKYTKDKIACMICAVMLEIVLNEVKE